MKYYSVLVYCLLIFLSCTIPAGATVGYDESAHLFSKKDSISFENINQLLMVGSYIEAELQARELLIRIEATLGSESLETAAILDQLVVSLQGSGKSSNPETLEIAKQSVRIKEKFFGIDNLLIAESLHRLAQVAEANLNFAKAESSNIRGLAIREKYLGVDHLEVANSLFSLALFYSKIGRYEEAKPLFNRAYTIQEKAQVLNYKSPAKHLLDLGQNLINKDKEGLVLSLFELAFSIGKSVFKKDNQPNLAKRLSILAGLYWNQNKFTEAESILRLVIRIWERALGTEHPEVARTKSTLARLYWNQENYSEAELLYEEALAIRLKTLGHEHPVVLVNIRELADVYKVQGKFAKAEELYKMSLELQEDISGPNDLQIATCLNRLANLYMYTGDFNKAESLYERSLTINESAYGREHWSVNASLNNLANLYTIKGEYSKAEPIYKSVLQTRVDANSQNGVDVAQSLSNLANLYFGIGKFQEAELYFNEALESLEKRMGSEHISVAATLNNIGILHQILGKNDSAVTLLNRSLAIYKRIFGHNHPEVARVLSTLANIHMNQWEYTQAELLHNRALKVREKALGKFHPDVALNLINLAELSSVQGSYVEANDLFVRALNMFEICLGQDHPNLAWALERYSKHKRLFKKTDIAWDLAKRAVEIRQKSFDENAHILTERDALSFAIRLHKSVDNLLCCYMDLDIRDTHKMKAATDMILKSKGLVTDLIHDRNKLITTDTNPEMALLADSLRIMRFLISKRIVSDQSSIFTADASRLVLDSLTSIANRLESEIALQSSSFAKIKSSDLVSYESVESHLPSKSILLEYLKFNYLNAENDSINSHYVVVVIRKDSTLDIIDLGNADPIESIMREYRRQLLDISKLARIPSIEHRNKFANIAKLLHDAVIQPVEKYLEKDRLVFIAPDGFLNLLSFAVLMDQTETYMVEKYPIQLLTAGRDLISLTENSESGKDFLVMGDPDYNATVEERLRITALPDKHQVKQEHSYGKGNDHSSCGELNTLIVSPLPYTRNEVEAIVRHWDATNTDSVIIHLGAEASEENFKANAPGKRIIHLATHGFYFEGKCGTSQIVNRIDEDDVFRGENPLLLSGLLLAGSNLHGEKTLHLNADDGILTSEEVSAMDLGGTRLVVLSACESGLGEIKEGEGVFGLRRAFQMAGARTVVSALWPVPDKETAEIMSELYRESKVPLFEKLRRIQVDKIEELRNSGFTDHPYTWGAFIALGDWR